MKDVKNTEQEQVVRLASIRVVVVLGIHIPPTAKVIGLHRWDAVYSINQKTGEARDRAYMIVFSKECTNYVILILAVFSVLAEFFLYWPTFSRIGRLFPVLAGFLLHLPSLSSV